VRRILSAAAAIAALASASGARAQVAPVAPEAVPVGDWQVAPLLQVRARGEYVHDLDTADRGLVVERVRLGVDAGRGPVEARVTLQDARAIDVADDLLAGPAAQAFTGAYEAWGEVHSESARPSFVRVGRQAVTWGEGRLLGSSDWSPAGRSLDAVRGHLVIGDGAVEALAATLLDPAVPDALRMYGQLLGLRGQWTFDPLLSVEGYALVRLAQQNPETTSFEGSVKGQTYTGALRVHGDARPWSWGVEGAYQLGHVDDLFPTPGTAAPPIARARGAWAAAGHAGYTFERVLLVPTILASVSYASGDSGGSTYRAFDPLLPDVHVWQGAMDLFAWSNEAEASGRVAIAPWTDAVAAVAYRYAWLAQPGGAWTSGYLTTIGRLPNNTRSGLGHEIDASLSWSPWASVALLAGYSVVAFGPGARAITGNDFAHLGYAQAEVSLP